MSTVQIIRSGSSPVLQATRPSVSLGTPALAAHNTLSGRSTADAHPTSAITGLDAALAAKQPLDADLTAIAGLTSAADTVPYFTGPGAAALASLTAAGRALIAGASASAQLTTLGIASLATSGIAGTITLSKSGTTARTVTFPDAAITVAGLEVANVFSAAQSISISSGTSLTLGSASGASSAIATSLGNLIRHQRYGYSAAYTAVQIGDAARGIGFGIDPNTIAGGQFSGDNRDFFMRRGSFFIVPNAGGTDWESVLGLSGGSGTASQPTVKIDGTGLGIGCGLSSVAERFIVIGGTAPSSASANEIRCGAGKIRCGDTSATSIQTAGGITHADTTLLRTSVALTNGAAAATGTLTNAPAAGNPTKWVPINDNGTTRYIPAW